MTKPPQEKVIDQLPALMRYARSLVRGDAAEDLVHDTLVAAYSHADRFQRERSLRVWLFSILHNRFVSDVRRQATRERYAADALHLADEISPPEQEHALRLRQVERALAALNPDQREALHLVAVEGLSYQDAAAVLDVPIGTLISRISRARTRLREMEEGSATAPAARLRIVRE